MLHETWHDQYDRMIRSRDRLACSASPTWQEGSAAARDALYHFFQDAYHLKDWLLADRPAGIRKSDVTDLFHDAASPVEMHVCADVCNRTKHFTLKIHAKNRRQDNRVHIPERELG